MSSITKLIAFCLLFTSTFSAAVSAVNDTRESGSSPLLSGVAKSPLKNVLRLNPPLPTSLGDRMVTCDPGRFGMPPVASCSDAISQMPHPDVRLTNRKRSYGPRGGTHQRYDVELPKRWISCKAPPCPEMSLEQCQDPADVCASRR